MLTPEQINKIADTLKVDVEILTTAITSQETVNLELPKVNVFKDEELVTLKENIGKDKYKEGKKAGSEMTIKDIKKVAEIEIEGKDVTTVISALKSKIENDAKIEPNTKVAELQKDNELLRGKVTEFEQTISDKDTEFSQYKHKAQILSVIPTNTVGLSNETVLADLKANGYEFGADGVKKNGEIVKDNLQNPLKVEDVITSFMQEKNWLKGDKAGRGAGDQGGRKTSVSINSMEDYENYCRTEQLDPMSDEAKAVLIEAREINKF